MRILLIDDSPDDREMVRRALRRSENWCGSVVEAENGSSALRCLQSQKFDCVLLDYSLPGNDGLIVLGEIALREPDLAVVMITGEGSERVAVSALKQGASDYVSKSELSAETLFNAIQHAREMKNREVEILRHANIDQLTGLPNRRVFNERLENTLQRSARERQPFAITFMDLDGFKAVNDEHGHDTGDVLLQQVSSRLLGCLRAGDLLARIGGDEFVTILENLPADDVGACRRAVARMSSAIGDTGFEISGAVVRVSLSIGLALYPRNADNKPALLRLADQAMYENKRGGRPLVALRTIIGRS